MCCLILLLPELPDGFQLALCGSDNCSVLSSRTGLAAKVGSLVWSPAVGALGRVVVLFVLFLGSAARAPGSSIIGSRVVVSVALVALRDLYLFPDRFRGSGLKEPKAPLYRLCQVHDLVARRCVRTTVSCLLEYDWILSCSHLNLFP